MKNSLENQHPKMMRGSLGIGSAFKCADVQNINYSVEEITDTLNRVFCNPAVKHPLGQELVAIMAVAKL